MSDKTQSMEEMQREALREQAAADAGMSMEEMQQEAMREQAAADMQANIGGSAVEQQQSRQTSEPDRLNKLVNRYLFDMANTEGKVVNYIILVMIITSVYLTMIETVDEVHEKWGETIYFVQLIILITFLLEYLLRIYSARQRLEYIRSFHGIIDLLTVLPLFLGNFSPLAVRILRLIRMFKLAAHFPVLVSLLRSISGAIQMIAAAIGSIAVISIMVGNLAYIAEPQTFANAFEGVWWSLVTMSTVGYGDIVPISAQGKLLAAMLILTGICTFAMVTAVISVRVGRMVNMTTKCLGCDKPISPEFNFCPHCGQDQSDDIDLFTDSE